MKTRRFISVLRAAVEKAALVAVMLVAIIYFLRQYALYNFAQTHWYIGAIVLSGYALLAVSEDYLNRRILH